MHVAERGSLRQFQASMLWRFDSKHCRSDPVEALDFFSLEFSRKISTIPLVIRGATA